MTARLVQETYYMHYFKDYMSNAGKTKKRFEQKREGRLSCKLQL